MKQITQNFNSIKVRLERLNIVRLYANKTFQFHKGTIRTARNYIENLRIAHFNSIKVRLEPAATQISFNVVVSFQFHKGTIRTSSVSVSL